MAEELGYDTIWLTEHHFAEDGYSPSLLPIAGTLSAMTGRVRIGTFLILLPLHNACGSPEDAATVDILSNGRFDLGLGQGYAPAEFAAMAFRARSAARAWRRELRSSEASGPRIPSPMRGTALPVERYSSSAQTGPEPPPALVDRRQRAQRRLSGPHV